MQRASTKAANCSTLMAAMAASVKTEWHIGSRQAVNGLTPILSEKTGGNVAQNHYSTKPKRRNKSGRRKDWAAATMAKLKQLETNAAGK